MNEMEARIAELMDRLDRNIGVVTNDPERVLNGHFKGVSRSGVVTVWVDLLGRVERVNLARDSVREGDEQFLINELMDANANARSNAENLRFDDEPQTPPPVPDDGEAEGGILRSSY
jgi:hypothetical protein